MNLSQINVNHAHIASHGRRDSGLMIRCFRSSRIIMALGIVLSLGLSAYLFYHRPNVAVWLNGVAGVLVLALGYVITRLIANMIAANINAKLLGILHVDLEPDRFISHYTEVPAHLKADSLNRGITTLYLADGYAAKGDWAQAEALLAGIRVEKMQPRSAAAFEAACRSAGVDYALQREMCIRDRSGGGAGYGAAGRRGL